jgi:hypothetical protein
MDTWAILELMGHRTRAGHVSEVELFGSKMLRLDIPGAERPEYYMAAAIYGFRVCTEEEARNHYSVLRRPQLAAPKGAEDDVVLVEESDSDIDDGEDGAETLERYGESGAEGGALAAFIDGRLVPMQDNEAVANVALQALAGGASALGVADIALGRGDGACEILATLPGAVQRATLYSDGAYGPDGHGPQVIRSVTATVAGVEISGQWDARRATSEEMPALEEAEREGTAHQHSSSYRTVRLPVENERQP